MINSDEPLMDFVTDRAHPGTLVEITRAQLEYMLNMLPPRYANGCFAMGEPVAHTKDGVTYHWAGERGGKCYACYGTKTEAERAFAR